MIIKKNKILRYAALLIFFLYLFFVYNPNFHGTDKPIYFAYTKSVVEDGDLNVINQYYSNFMGRFNVTGTYNLPDCRSHGSILLWIPFYSYAKAAYFMAVKLNFKGLTKEGLDRVAKCAMSFSTIVFSFIALLLTYKLTAAFFTPKISFWSNLIIFIGMGYLYFTVYEAGQANIVACLFAILSIWFLTCAIDTAKKSHWFLYGLFFSICTIVKIDLWFQIFFIFFIFIMLLLRKQTDLVCGIYFLFGFVPVRILKAINDFILYGGFRTGEFGVLSPAVLYHHGPVISAYHNFFYLAPISWICLLGFVLLVISFSKKNKILDLDKSKINDLFLLILGLYLIIKIFIISLTFSLLKFFFNVSMNFPIDIRLLLTELPVFALLYARAMQGQKRLLMYFIAGTSVFFVFWHLLVMSEHITEMGQIYMASGMPSISIRVINTFQYIADQLFYVKDLGLKLNLCLPLIAAALWVIYQIEFKFKTPDFSHWHLRKVGNHKLFRFFVIFTAYLFITYLVITLLNMYNSKMNLEKLKADGFFKNATVINPAKYNLNIVVSPLNVQSIKPYYSLEAIYRERKNINRANECIKKSIEFFEKAIRFNPRSIYNYKNLGDIYMDIREYNKAIECFKKAIQLDPADSESYRKLAIIYHLLSDNYETIEYSKKFAYYYPAIPDPYFFLGTAYNNIGQYDRAAEYFEKASELNINVMEVYLYLWHFYQEKDQDKALEYFEKSVEIRRNSAEDFYNLGVVYFEKAKFSKPIEYYQNVVKTRPDAKSYYELGVAYENRCEINEAILAFQKALQINPDYGYVYHSLGDIYGAMGEYDKEMEYLKKAIKLIPDDMDIYHIPRLTFGKKIYYDKAAEYFKKAINLNSKYHQAYFYLGLILKEKISPLAVEYIQKAIELDPKNADYRYSLGEILYPQDYPGSIKYFQEAINHGYKDPFKAYYYLGIIYLKIGNHDEALVCFRNAITVNPNCVEDLQKAISLTPNNGDYYFALGMMLYEKADKRAIEYLKNAIEYGYNDFAQTHYYLGIAYEKNGDNDNAFACFLKAVEIDQNWDAAFYELGNIYILRRDNASALIQAAKLRKLKRADLAEKLEQVLKHHIPDGKHMVK